MSNCKHYDIAIVGAGLAGAALATALSHPDVSERLGGPLSIALIEAQRLPQTEPASHGGLLSYDLRASALTYSTIQWLDSIDVWSDVARKRTGVFHDMHVWVEEGTGAIAFSSDALGVPELGEVVENRLLVYTMHQRLAAQAGCELIDGAGVESLEYKAQTASQSSPVKRLVLGNGLQLDADLVVAADGAQSIIRTLVDMPVRRWDYGHDAIVCNVEMEKPHCDMAIQRFTRCGPVAFLPLGMSPQDASNTETAGHANRLCSIVWSQTRERAQHLMTLDDNAFKQALADSIEQRLGRVVAISQRRSFPLTQQHAIDYVKDGVVLVADAAHTVHPLAGQGINLGLMDVALLVETVVQSLQTQNTVADARLLRRYQRQRKTENLGMMAIIEAFKRIYQPQPLPVTTLRNYGMNLLNDHDTIKNQIIRYAMGLQPQFK